MTAKMYYDNDADPAALAGQTVAIIGYGSQGHAHALNLHESGVDVVVGLAPGLEEPAAGRGGRAARRRRRRRGQGGRRDHDPRPRHGPEGRLRHRHRAEPPAGPAADVRPRLQHPLRADRPAGRHRRRDGRAEGPRPPPPQRVPGRRRRPVAVRGPSRRLGHGPPARPRLCPGPRLHPRGRPRDDVRRGDRDRPVRRAVGPLRRHGGAREDVVRDARRGRLPARARLLRDDARAEADRRPAVPRRPQLHALQRQRHRRVRRLRVRPADHRRARPRDDAPGPRRDPGRLVREPLDRRERGGPPGVRAAPRRRPRPPDRAGRRGPPGPDGVPQPGRRPGGAGPGRRRDGRRAGSKP